MNKTEIVIALEYVVINNEEMYYYKKTNVRK